MGRQIGLQGIPAGPDLFDPGALEERDAVPWEDQVPPRCPHPAPLDPLEQPELLEARQVLLDRGG
jgi:hypothetical protein